MEHILVTGSRGFVGQHLVPRLLAVGHTVTAAVRDRAGDIEHAPHLKRVNVGDISAKTDWRSALDGCGMVIHLAGRTPGPGVPEDSFRKVNDEGTARLTEEAAETGVRLFILASSIFALVDSSADSVVTDDSVSKATSAYGRSKLAAEVHVNAFASSRRTGISLRPPLVYGARAKGNWQLLQRLAASGLPLPFGAIRNRRTLIAVENLADAIVKVTTSERRPAGGHSFAVADTESPSLVEILSLLRAGMGLPPRLLPVPARALSVPLRLVGRHRMAQSLFGNLEVDARRFREAYGWSPPETAQEAIRRSGAEFIPSRSR